MSEKNLHLVPVNVIDLVTKLSDKNIRQTERMNYRFRVEVIVAYCNKALRVYDDIEDKQAKKSLK